MEVDAMVLKKRKNIKSMRSMKWHLRQGWHFGAWEAWAVSLPSPRSMKAWSGTFGRAGDHRFKAGDHRFKAEWLIDGDHRFKA